MVLLQYVLKRFTNSDIITLVNVCVCDQSHSPLVCSSEYSPWTRVGTEVET